MEIIRMNADDRNVAARKNIFIERYFFIFHSIFYIIPFSLNKTKPRLIKSKSLYIRQRKAARRV